MCTLNKNCNLIAKSFGPEGCQVPVGKGICGETRTLQIINEFKRLYEEKMNQIDAQAGGDCLQEKFKLQQEWIGDLTDQNEMLVRAVEELEYEATERVKMLEEKLQHSAQCICEVMKRYREHDVTSDLLAEPLQKVFELENDKINLLEFIKRIRESGKWTIDGLKFYEINYDDLLGTKKINEVGGYVQGRNVLPNDENEDLLSARDKLISELQGKVNYYDSFGNIDSLAKDLKCKTQECESLRQSMVDMRQALTEEVAAKHDIILALKKDCQQLEERCMQADKQTAFKDDIIKELRKEIKQLKQQESELDEMRNCLEQSISYLESLNPLESPKDLNASNFVKKFKKSLKGSTGNKTNSASFFHAEFDRMSEHLRIKDAMLKEQLNLIAVLVQKLYIVDKGLQYLEERADSIVSLLEQENELLNSKIEEEKEIIDDLERQFEAFLRDKEELKQKRKECENLVKKSLLEIEKLRSENNSLMLDIDTLRRERDVLECSAVCTRKQLEDIVEERNKTVGEMVSLNEENRQLNYTIDQLRKKLDEARIKTDELSHLNETIEELRRKLHETETRQEHEERVNTDELNRLHCTVECLTAKLEQSELLREEDEKVKDAAISHLNCMINELQHNLKDAQDNVKVCKICKGRSKVGFVDAPNVCIENVEEMSHLEQRLLLMQNKEETIKLQNDTLKSIQLELQALKDKENETKIICERKQEEIQCLKSRILELEDCLQDAQRQSANLQLAVDLYLNSINVLEAAEEKSKLEIQQQKATIASLQDALVAAKHDLDELRQKTEDNILEQQTIISALYVYLLDSQENTEDLRKQVNYLTDAFTHLQDLNFEIEEEHYTSLQDIGVLDCQLSKYQNYLKACEEENCKCKHEINELLTQKENCEQMVTYFKEEMRVLAEQLYNLQNLLTLSNESAQEESSKLMQAFMEVQALNESLSSQLCTAERKVMLEAQKNHMSSVKIEELQQLLFEKDLDLARHDEAIYEIRQSLQSSLEQNEELRSTIDALNGTIDKLQRAVKSYESENNQTKENTQFCRSQINVCTQKLMQLKANLASKTDELAKLESAYNTQRQTLMMAQSELRELQQREEMEKSDLCGTIKELKLKLSQTEQNYGKLVDDFERLQTRLAQISNKEGAKEVEIKRYRKIVADLKRSLIELNKTLTNREFQRKCDRKECERVMSLSIEPSDVDDEEEYCTDCPCEIKFYQGIVETLKKSVIDLKAKLTDTQCKYKDLTEESRRKEEKLEELSRQQAKAQRECAELKNKLTEKLRQSEFEESRFTDLTKQFEDELRQMKHELEEKTRELNYSKRNAEESNSSRCIQLACAQEEVAVLKNEMNKLLQKQCSLNAENQKLHSQSVRLEDTVSNLEERSHHLKDQLEQYLVELQVLQNDKEALTRKNQELLSELRAIHCQYGSLTKHQRHNYDTVKNLELELLDVKNNRDDICNESRNVLGYVRAWLQEQKKINDQVARNERNYCSIIDKLMQEKDRPAPYPVLQKVEKPKISFAPISPPPVHLRCTSPWSLGSQGAGSYNDVEGSGRNSPCQECDWYSANFRTEESDDYEEEDWVNKVENLTAQVRKTNRMWRNKMSDYPTREPKK